jgi:hypothetical protein
MNGETSRSTTGKRSDSCPPAPHCLIHNLATSAYGTQYPHEVLRTPAFQTSGHFNAAYSELCSQVIDPSLPHIKTINPATRKQAPQHRFEPPTYFPHFQKIAKLKATSKCWLKELAFLFDSTGESLVDKYIYGCEGSGG